MTPRDGVLALVLLAGCGGDGQTGGDDLAIGDARAPGDAAGDLAPAQDAARAGDGASIADLAAAPDLAAAVDLAAGDGPIAGSCAPGGFGGACMPLDQMPGAVTLSKVAQGVTVRQLTANGGNAGPYYDVPALSACSGRIIYNHLLGMPNSHKGAFSAAEDGTQAVGCGTAIGSGLEGGVNLTGDGALAFFLAKNGQGNGIDLYDVAIGDPQCAQNRVSQRDLVPANDGDAEISTASWDAQAKQWVFAWAIDATVRRVREDGTNLPDVTLPDPGVQAANGFHRLRLDPACPNIVMYRRRDPQLGNAKGADQLWVVDLANDPNHAWAISDANNTHQLWSPDGRRAGYSVSSGKSYALADVVTAQCTLALANGAFATTLITPAQARPALFCTFAPGSSSLVCETGCGPGTDELFVLAPNGQTTLIARTDQDCVANQFLAQADAQLIGDREHLLFSSDRAGGVPEVYLATLPQGLVP
jgi:hypothetical protein